MLSQLRELLPFVPSNYPVNVVVWEKRSNGKRIRKQVKGRRLKTEERGYEYELSTGEKTGPVPFEAIDIGQNGEPTVYLYSPEKGEYLPAKFNFDEQEIQAVTDRSGAEAYRKNRYNKSRQFYQKKSLLERYQAPITIALFGFAFILMSAGLVHFFGNITEEQVEAANLMVDAANQLRE